MLKEMEKTIIVVAGLIQNGENSILLARRSFNKHLAGFWEFPGGKVEENEEEEDCLKRELLEELGVNILIKEFFMQNHHQYDKRGIILKSYFCEIKGVENFTLIDHDKVEWVSIEDLLNYKLAPADIPIARALNERNNI